MQPYEWLSLIYFFLLWAGYARFAKFRAKKYYHGSLSRALRNHREAWVARMLRRDTRITDAALLGNQDRVVSFFASTTLLLLAAVLTALSTSEQIAELVSHLPYATAQTDTQVEAKLLLLAVMLVYAFFKATWSLRQYGFAAIVMGGAPDPEEATSSEDREAFISNLGKLLDTAGHDNNSCLRSYYFSLAVIGWLASTVLFLLMTTVTVFVLYHREFRSSAVDNIQRAYVRPSG